MTDLLIDFSQAYPVACEKDKEIKALRDEVEELKTLLIETKNKKNARDKLLAELTNVLDEMIDLFPSFVPKTLSYDKKEAYLLVREKMVTTAIMKGSKNIADIVQYMEQYNDYIGRRVLRLILTELKKATIEEIFYTKAAAATVGNQNPSTIKYFDEVNGTILTYLFTTPLNNLIKDILPIGYLIEGRYELSVSVFQIYDGIRYSSQEDFVHLWNLKKRFAKQALNAISSYLDTLILVNEFSPGKPVCKEICRNCEQNHNIRDCTKECKGSCPRSYKSHTPKDCPARLLPDSI